ncbi:helix-turn-helix domain-containing protein [Nonomuraea jiangxiensis]|uniref:Uncharacterized protein n=1 Tax=Nonomuraea jiangxiensis TaxID=633440 RepID=A0A1G9R4V0_9ACTN|nr:hypothetical protein [Nonomuraea jiangxiensis]SDM17455.1 hypothetical protein SAMN05421869_13799 [Nonomuraea jiangxiensis]
MPKFQDVPEYAAAIAPVIDAAHVNVHAAARRAADELAEASGVTPGLLADLRFMLPVRPVNRPQLGTIYRYRDPAAHQADLEQHLSEGTLTRDGDGTLRLTDKGLKFIHGLYDLHAAATRRVWPDPGLPELADLAGRVLDAAEPLPGGALELASPPYEPVDAPPGLLLFNRIAVLRYHRADAHAASWRAAGLSAAEIVDLRDGPLRILIEAETNQRAAAPYRVLSEDERTTLYDGLMRLV